MSGNQINFLNKIKAFIKSYNLNPLILSSSCCNLEIELAFSRTRTKQKSLRKTRHELSKADVLIISGPINEKFAVLINETIQNSKKTKYIVALGDCTLGNELFKSNKSLKKLIDLLPVDISIPGCPPTPEAILMGLNELKLKIRHGYLKNTSFASEAKEASFNLHNHIKYGFQIHITKKEKILEKISILNGFAFRGIEKELIGKNISQTLPYLDKIDYHAPIVPEILFSKYFERHYNLKTDPSQNLFLELFRISSHLLNCAKLAKFYKKNRLYNLILDHQERLREFLSNFAGSRFNPGLFTSGRIKKNIDSNSLNQINELINSSSALAKRIERQILNNFFIKRTLSKLGVITKNQAINYSLSGPNLRATGLNIDCRKEDLFYNTLNFKPVLGMSGSAWDRFYVRLKEIEQSILLVRLIIKNYYTGKALHKTFSNSNNSGNFNFDFVDIEGPGGKLGFYIETQNSILTKFKTNTPSTHVVKMINEIIIDLPEKHLTPFLISFDIDIASVDK